MKKAFYILTMLLLLPACGTKSESASVPADAQQPAPEAAVQENNSESKAEAEKAKALLQAVKNYDFEKLEQLIADSVDLSAQDWRGMSTLHIAACSGNLELVKTLLEAGAYISARDNDGKMPLHYAANAGIAKLLLSCGTDVNVKDKNGLTPLDLATKRNRWKVEKLLLDHDAEWENPGLALISLVAGGAGPDAVAQGKKLLQQGADVNTRDDRGSTPLHRARDQEIVRFLIGNGADINARNDSGRTPLFSAVANCCEEIVNFLITCGADVNAADRFGLTPLHTAAKFGKKDIVERLISSGADVNATAKQGSTPLHSAIPCANSCYYTSSEKNPWVFIPSNIEVMQLLIEKGASVKARSNDGRTPLHVAAKWKKGEIAKFLLTEGAEVNALDNDGRTPLNSTQESDLEDLEDLAQLLRKHGGKSGKE